MSLLNLEDGSAILLENDSGDLLLEGGIVIATLADGSASVGSEYWPWIVKSSGRPFITKRVRGG